MARLGLLWMGANFFSFLSLSVMRFRREGASFGGAGVEKGAQEAAEPVDSCQSSV